MSNLLQVFLCYSPVDEQTVYTIYERLKADGYKPWMEAEDVYGGQNTSLEVSKAIKSSQVVLICMSQEGLSRAGVLNKGINQALDKAAEQPEGAISVVSLRLNECEIPTRLQDLKPLNLFPGSDGFERGYGRLLRTLAARALEVNATPGNTATSSSVAPSEQAQNNVAERAINTGGGMYNEGTVNTSGGVSLSGGSNRDIISTDNRGATINNYYGFVPKTSTSKNNEAAPAIPINVPDREITAQEKFKIIDLLGHCPSMQNAATREAITSELSFADKIPFSPIPKLHITQIVSTCQHYHNGLSDLFQLLNNFDGATKEYADLLTYVDSLSKKI